MRKEIDYLREAFDMVSDTITQTHTKFEQRGKQGDFTLAVAQAARLTIIKKYCAERFSDFGFVQDSDDADSYISAPAKYKNFDVYLYFEFGRLCYLVQDKHGNEIKRFVSAPFVSIEAASDFIDICMEDSSHLVLVDEYLASYATDGLKQLQNKNYVKCHSEYSDKNTDLRYYYPREYIDKNTSYQAENGSPINGCSFNEPGDQRHYGWLNKADSGNLKYKVVKSVDGEGEVIGQAFSSADFVEAVYQDINKML